jgi:hypothetical protein
MEMIGRKKRKFRLQILKFQINGRGAGLSVAPFTAFYRVQLVNKPLNPILVSSNYQLLVTLVDNHKPRMLQLSPSFSSHHLRKLEVQDQLYLKQPRTNKGADKMASKTPSHGQKTLGGV